MTQIKYVLTLKIPSQQQLSTLRVGRVLNLKSTYHEVDIRVLSKTSPTLVIVARFAPGEDLKLRRGKKQLSFLFYGGEEAY